MNYEAPTYGNGVITVPACQSVLTDEDEQLLEEALSRTGTNEVATLSPEMKSKLGAPDFQARVQSALSQRCLWLMEENHRERSHEYSERLTGSGRELTLLETVDRDQWPTPRERQATWTVGRQFRMSAVEIANLPALKVIADQNPVPLIRETISSLHKSKMPSAMWQEYAVNKVVFLDRRAVPGIPKDVLAYVDSARALQEDPSRLKVVHIISDSEGTFPTGKDLLWNLAHEICHLHEVDSSGAFRVLHDMAHAEEWEAAVAAQLKRGPVSYYAADSLIRAGLIGFKSANPDEIAEAACSSEFISEHFAAWVTDSKRDYADLTITFKASPLCTEMSDFFTKYVPETFS